jgi:parvulin-like peptidyl-prolyl isomerase
MGSRTRWIDTDRRAGRRKRARTQATLLSALCCALAVLALVGCNGASGLIPPPQPYVSAATATAVPVRPGETPPTPAPENPGEPVAATVDGKPISMQEYQMQVSEWESAFVSQNANLNDEEKQAMLTEGRRQVLDVMIEQVLIEQAAAREGIALSDKEVESVIQRDIEENGGRDQFDAWLAANSWTYDEYKARQRSMMIASQMFEQVTRNVPTKAEQVHARHILVATEAEARDILSKLQGGADFAEMARQYSLDPSTKDSGGDLGFFPRGTLVVPEVEDVAFSLSVGQISDVIQSPLGYHIVQVVERAQDKDLTEESWQALKEATFRRWVSELWQAADIHVSESL